MAFEDTPCRDVPSHYFWSSGAAESYCHSRSGCQYRSNPVQGLREDCTADMARYEAG